MGIEGGLPSPVKRRKTGSGSSSSKSQRSQSHKSSSSKQNYPKVTKKDMAKVKSAQKAQRKQAWNTWLARDENRWSPEEDPNYKQEVGWQVIRYSDAKKYYRFSDEEMETLHTPPFDDQHHLDHPGRSFHRPHFVFSIFSKRSILRWERVYENDKKIGYWLVLHFDPDADEGPSPSHPNREERFWLIDNGYPNW